MSSAAATAETRSHPPRLYKLHKGPGQMAPPLLKEHGTQGSNKEISRQMGLRYRQGCSYGIYGSCSIYYIWYYTPRLGRYTAGKRANQSLYEISMIDSGYISKLDAVARALRTRGKPMGGLRVIMCGDFLHLPPVTKDYDKLFLSEWWKTAKVQTILFRNPMRQKEPWFVADLNKYVAERLEAGVQDAYGVTIWSRHQFPLILAWAIAIHKAQGATLELANVDLQGCFDADPDAVEFYKSLERPAENGGMPQCHIKMTATNKEFLSSSK
ncbi:uncharacterized protein VP01_3830g1 [Puccinia sorghi]|uniref:ATP-dependent DNA helicase n=1 Tax=Puccinia sorghi TaxID=27349 RepID=A0A0L6UU12_9BASI|nr:uncharacterized protein VP01_3830g1 [Puccinia sorghi]